MTVPKKPITALKKRIPPTALKSAGSPLPKEEPKHEVKEVPSKGKPARPEVKASAPTARSRAEESGPRPAPAPKEEVIPEHEDQVSHRAMLELSFTARHDLWKQINKDAPPEQFITLIRVVELPKAVKKEFPPAANTKPHKEALWCPYCGEWMKFRTFSYTGYECCTGCGISTRDFHTASANKLF